MQEWQRLEELLDRAEVNPRQRLELHTCPPLAIELLEYALKRPRIRNPAAFAVARFRRRMGRPLEEARERWLRRMGAHYAHDRDTFHEEFRSLGYVYPGQAEAEAMRLELLERVGVA
jgi:hypothetical protein